MGVKRETGGKDIRKEHLLLTFSGFGPKAPNDSSLPFVSYFCLSLLIVL